MLVMDSISKFYNQSNNTLRLFENLSISIESGKWITIVGPSGSGKTTLLNCLSGLLPPDNGKVLFREVDIYQLKDDSRSNFRKKNIGFVFQDFKLLPYYSVLDNVVLPLIHDEGKSSLYSRAKELLEKVGITEDKYNRLPDTLSGGEKQRVAIARALIASPAVLIGDEPTGNLDRDNRNQIVELLDTLRESGQTIILVTHDEEVAKHGDETYRLSNGFLELMEVQS